MELGVDGLGDPQCDHTNMLPIKVNLFTQFGNSI